MSEQAKKPTHSLRVYDRRTKRYSKIGVGWLHVVDGKTRMSISLSPGTVLSYHEQETLQLIITAFEVSEDWQG